MVYTGNGLIHNSGFTNSIVIVRVFSFIIVLTSSENYRQQIILNTKNQKKLQMESNLSPGIERPYKTLIQIHEANK